MKAEQFWLKVDKSGDCWVWLGSTNNKGYGVVSRKGKRIGAHREAYTIARGAIPNGMLVCHRCDNPRCVNPDHLFLGTNRDNIDDMLAKQRHARGEMQGNAKLTDERVREMRALHRQGVPTRQLARQFNVAQRTAVTVVRRIAWSHVND